MLIYIIVWKQGRLLMDGFGLGTTCLTPSGQTVSTIRSLSSALWWLQPLVCCSLPMAHTSSWSDECRPS